MMKFKHGEVHNRVLMRKSCVFLSNSPEDGFGLRHGQSSQPPAVHVHDLVPDEKPPVSATAESMLFEAGKHLHLTNFSRLSASLTEVWSPSTTSDRSTLAPSRVAGDGGAIPH